MLGPLSSFSVFSGRGESIFLSLAHHGMVCEEEEDESGECSLLEGQ